MMVPAQLQRTQYHYRSVLEAPDLLAVFNEVGVLDPIDIHSALTVCGSLKEVDSSVMLAAALTVRGTRFGHVCVDLSAVRTSVSIDGVPAELVDSLPWPEPARWLAALQASPIVGDGSPAFPLVLNGPLVYLERYWAYEASVLANLKRRMAAAPRSLPDLADPLRDLFPGEDDLQRLAAAMAATGQLTVIAGGPGTGKTYTIARLLALLFEDASRADGLVPVIAVAAPTGKAAARLTEHIRSLALSLEAPSAIRDRLLSVEASTLHRLLGWTFTRGRFRHSVNDPLPHDTVIVDEMSMVSLPMMAKLLDAVHADARVVLVGDPNQLMSIEAGTVLGDMVGPSAEELMISRPERARLSELTGDPVPGNVGPGGMGDHVITLDRVFRFDRESPVAELADAIRRGDGDRAMNGLASSDSEVRWFDTTDRAIEDLAEITNDLVDHAARLIELGERGDGEGALAQLQRLALLCAHRRGEVGVGHWVRWIERQARPAHPAWTGELWYIGRPVMVTTNEYRLGVFNGDIGVTVRNGDRVAVAFSGSQGVRMIGPTQLPSTETAHAMTIHKSQGSQFERVIVLVPDEESRLLTRELLYTAVTRAKSQVTVVGTEAAIRAAIARRVTRSSGLGEALWSG